MSQSRRVLRSSRGSPRPDPPASPSTSTWARSHHPQDLTTGLLPPSRARPPTSEQGVLDADHVEHLARDEVDELLHALGRVVERRARRQHHRARVVQRQQVRQRAAGERRLARHDDQRPPLLERDVGGTLQQVLRQPERDARDRTPWSRARPPCPWPGTSRTTVRPRGRPRASSATVGRAEVRGRATRPRSSRQCASRNERPVSSSSVSREARDTTRSTGLPGVEQTAQHRRGVRRAATRRTRRRSTARRGVVVSRVPQAGSAADQVDEQRSRTARCR